ncbi:anti-sigma factor family protein [Limibacillus halophilus]|uniref:Uncharacterized protein n=1 Tax=Limibacillus halophilus TaxID=1579333 RepID=A0A839SUD4_9PROT|nr:hypothetical protein [Limibacillus halophilus]MBB3064543.1 hypothetical protein [Limibacillus halophilus]
MTTDKDWNLLNSYADDELKAEQRMVLEARIQQEPDLAAALERIQTVKLTLGRTQPLAAPPTSSRLRSLSRVGAIAAGIVVVVGISIFGLRTFQVDLASNTAADWHAKFSANSYSQDQPQVSNAAFGAWAGFIAPPDLSIARLELMELKVDASEDPAFIAMHYRGQNGCRLTLLVEKLEIDEDISDQAENLLWRQWTTEEARFSLISDTMDRGRFNMIAAYLESATQTGRSNRDLQVAMAESTASCA